METLDHDVTEFLTVSWSGPVSPTSVSCSEKDVSADARGASPPAAQGTGSVRTRRRSDADLEQKTHDYRVASSRALYAGFFQLFRASVRVCGIFSPRRQVRTRIRISARREGGREVGRSVGREDGATAALRPGFRVSPGLSSPVATDLVRSGVIASRNLQKHTLQVWRSRLERRGRL